MTAPTTVPASQRVPDPDLGALIHALQAGAPVITNEAGLDLALDLAQARADLRHQAQVRAALADTARAAGARARMAEAAHQ